LDAANRGHRRGKHSFDKKAQADWGNILSGREGIKDIIDQWESLIQAQERGSDENFVAMLKMLKNQLALIMSLTEPSCDHLSSLGLLANPRSGSGGSGQ
jgi:hypothetical protein